MEMTYTTIVFITTYIVGAITKTFADNIPNRFIPIQNVIIGVFSGFVCYFIGFEENLVTSLILCIVASLGAGGTADLMKVGEK